MDTTQLLSVNEAAARLRMLPARLSRLARRGHIPYVALPDGEVRFSPRDLESLVELCRRAAQPEALQ
jgi:hypothetical protein